MTDQFIVAYRNGREYVFSHSESSYSEAAMTVPPVDMDGTEYIVVCPPGFVREKVVIETINDLDLPY